MSVFWLIAALLGPIDHSKLPEFIPWVEMNNNRRDIEHIKAGLHYYEQFCDRIIITAITGEQALITKMDEATSMSVIPSIKTYSYYAGGRPGMKNRGTPDYDDLDGWRRLAKEIEEYQSLGYKVINLENESVIRPVFKEEHPEPNWSLVAKGIDLLPKDLTYVLYPSSGSCGGRPRPMALAEKYLQAWARGVPDVIFVDYSTMGTPDCIDNSRLINAVKRMRDINDRLMPMAYLNPAPAYWGLARERFFEMLHVHDMHYRDAPLILYPGNRAFTEAGRRLAQFLEVTEATGETD
jgi:hypothetical protein